MEQKSQKALISLLFIGVLMGALDISIVGPAIPSIETYLNLEPRFSGWIFSIYILFNLIGISLFARLSDIYGVKRIVIAGLLLLAAGFYLLSLTGGQKIIYYFSGVLVGLGLSVLAGSSLRYIMLNNTSSEDRATSQGMLTIFISVGQITGTAVIGLLMASLSGGRVFVNIFSGVAVMLLIMFFLSMRLENVVIRKHA